MEHGLLPEAEADKAYKRWLIKRGRSAPAAKKSSGGKTPAKSSGVKGGKVKKEPVSTGKKKPAAKAKVKPGVKRKATMIEDDDSDEEMPLASLKSNGGGFKIPKATPSKAEKMAIKEEIGK